MGGWVGGWEEGGSLSASASSSWGKGKTLPITQEEKRVGGWVGGTNVLYYAFACIIFFGRELNLT